MFLLGNGRRKYVEYTEDIKALDFKILRKDKRYGAESLYVQEKMN